MINFSGRLLHAFLVLAETRHFTLAAQRSHVSQSAFSQMIARLERQAGTRLFDRTTRNVTLTPEGEVFAVTARRLAADIEETFANLRDRAARRKGRVALAALPSLAADWLPRVIGEFRRRYPGIAVQLFDAVADRSLALLREGAVDFALTAASDLREFEARLLFSEPFYLVCPRGHALAGRKQVRLADLAGVDFIHSVRTGSVYPQIQPLVAKAGVNDTGLECAHLSTLAGFVAHGVGVSIMPAFSMFEFARPDIATARIADKSLVRPVYLVSRRGRSLSVASQAMIEMIDAQKPTMPPRRPKPAQDLPG